VSSHPLEEILHPKSIGGSRRFRNQCGRALPFGTAEIGFLKGKYTPFILSIRKSSALNGYPRVRDIPENVDFVISTIPGEPGTQLNR